MCLHCSPRPTECWKDHILPLRCDWSVSVDVIWIDGANFCLCFNTLWEHVVSKLGNFCYIIQKSCCDLDVKWPVRWDSLTWHDGVMAGRTSPLHVPGAALTFLILNPPNSMPHFLAPSAWKELNLVWAARMLQRAGFVSDGENGTPETRPN